MIKAIVAVRNPDGAIGYNNELIHCDKFDMKNFSKVTKEAGTVLMGRRTAESLGKPLKGRVCYVVSGSEWPNLVKAGFKVITPNEAWDLLQDYVGIFGDDIFIIGGSLIYKAFYPITEEYHVTVLGAGGNFQKELMERPADTRLELGMLNPHSPEFGKWEITSRTFINPDNPEIILYVYKRLPL